MPATAAVRYRGMRVWLSAAALVTVAADTSNVASSTVQPVYPTIRQLHRRRHVVELNAHPKAVRNAAFSLFVSV
jgi:hypothetical protein